VIRGYEGIRPKPGAGAFVDASAPVIGDIERVLRAEAEEGR